ISSRTPQSTGPLVPSATTTFSRSSPLAASAPRISGPAQIDRDTSASTAIPGNCSSSDGADASMTESPTAVISVPAGTVISSSTGESCGASAGGVGDGVAPAFSTASAPLLIAATAEVVCGALTTAAVVPPIATSATVSAASPVNLLVGVPPIRRPN